MSASNFILFTCKLFGDIIIMELSRILAFAEITFQGFYYQVRR